MKNLRHQILKLLYHYTNLEMPVPFSFITENFPTKSYKNLSMQLSNLKKRGLVATKGPKCSYLFYITPRGIAYLNFIEAKIQRALAIQEADIDLELARTQSFM